MVSASAPRPEDRPEPRSAAIRRRFFGEYLVQAGACTPEQIRSALERMAAVNVRIGDLATERGFVTEEQAEELNRLQRVIDRPWGELACDLQYIDSDDLTELLELQAGRNLRIGDALVELGVLTSEYGEALAAAFHAEEASIDVARLLPANYVDIGPIARNLVTYLPRVSARLLGVPVCVADIHLWTGTPALAVQATIAIEQGVGFEVGMSVTTEFARHMASRVLNLPRSVIDDEMLGDALGEFLNVLIGGTRTAQGVPAIHCFSPPHVGELPGHGVAFELRLGDALGLLVVAAAV